MRSELAVKSLYKSFGGLHVFEDLSFTLPAGEILGVIGPNGAGKTTLINVVSGQLLANKGQVLLNGIDISQMSFHGRSHRGLIRSFQHTNTFRTATVRENIERAVSFSKGFNKPAIPHLTKLLKKFDLYQRLDQSSENLPYGLQKLLGLLLVYAASPNYMMLDEPAAGLESSERYMVDEFVKDALTNLECGVLIVEHDMELVRRLCPTIMVLDDGRIIAQGNTEDVLQKDEVIQAYLGTADEEEAQPC